MEEACDHADRNAGEPSVHSANAFRGRGCLHVTTFLQRQHDACACSPSHRTAGLLPLVSVPFRRLNDPSPMSTQRTCSRGRPNRHYLRFRTRLYHEPRVGLEAFAHILSDGMEMYSLSTSKVTRMAMPYAYAATDYWPTTAAYTSSSARAHWACYAATHQESSRVRAAKTREARLMDPI